MSVEEGSVRRPWQAWALAVTELFIPGEAVYGGVGLITDSWQLPPQWLARTPFDTWVGPGARLDKVVVDKDVYVGAGAVVGTGNESVANIAMPDKLFAGITVVGKGASIPEQAVIGRNVLINSSKHEQHFPANGKVADGKTV